MRSTDSSDLFFGLVEVCQQFGSNGPVLTCKQRELKHLQVGLAEGYHSTSVQEQYTLRPLICNYHRNY